ncbi:MAG: riboflavin kinase, partial [Clostridia bacterium]
IEFLDKIFDNKNIRAVVVGNDYTYGLQAVGNIQTLAAYCQSKNIELTVENLKLADNGSKLSSRDIRAMVSDGRVEEIFLQLGSPYIIIGKVVKGRGDGRKNFFATANVELDKDKVFLRAGVYYCRVIVDGVSLKAVCNVGPHPTYNDFNYNIEAHIIYFNQEIYGKEVVIEFYKRLRETEKFDSKEELQKAINNDVERALEID